EPTLRRLFTSSSEHRMPAKAKASPSGQHDRFKQLARELECDESDEAFERALDKVAHAPAQPKYEPKKRKPKGGGE
ncbi:MAG TPA: hypothetical protein VHB27_17280, partial [Rhodopila sp.]|uniref:hypothetical protein n=1 Tax=Rhodopila sp. TaxID=2480087 RepID=UPI002BD5AE65